MIYRVIWWCAIAAAAAAFILIMSIIAGKLLAWRSRTYRPVIRTGESMQLCRTCHCKLRPPHLASLPPDSSVLECPRCKTLYFVE